MQKFLKPGNKFYVTATENSVKIKFHNYPKIPVFERITMFEFFITRPMEMCIRDSYNAVRNA